MSQRNSLSSISRSDRVTRYNRLRRKIDCLVSETTDLTPESASKANEVWREVNSIPVEGADTDEILLAIRLNENVVNFFQDNLPKLQIVGALTLDDFVLKIRENVDRSGWCEGLESFNFLRSCVSFQSLNQRQPPPPVLSTYKEKKPRKKKANGVPVEATQPTQVECGSQRERKGVHADLVDQTLRRIYNSTKAPVEFWSFVTDPNSFENTIENMFSVNILVNNNKFKLYTDKEGQKFLEPVTVTSNQDKATKKQMFLSVSIDEYIEQIKRLGITTAVITRWDKESRDHSDSD